MNQNSPSRSQDQEPIYRIIGEEYEYTLDDLRRMARDGEITEDIFIAGPSIPESGIAAKSMPALSRLFAANRNVRAMNMALAINPSSDPKKKPAIVRFLFIWAWITSFASLALVILSLLERDFTSLIPVGIGSVVFWWIVALIAHAVTKPERK
jgi:hypothetical protein